jgi:uncharacterized protein YbbC (DUF1343 family)
MVVNGIDRILQEPRLVKGLGKKRVGFIGHPASVTRNLQHSLYALHEQGIVNLSCAFGPQHGMMGEKQYNMNESPDYHDPKTGIPVYSLYSETRRPTAAMMEGCDVLFYDLQDVGCRIYTYLATLRYVMEAAAQYNKEVWILDRPNPVGRPIEGFKLDLAKWESFVGSTSLPMRHGLTMGEAAKWLCKEHKISVPLKVIEMEGYRPEAAPDFGWPSSSHAWINPSPNIPSLAAARVYPGAVLIEGTTLSDGRGTTRPFEIFGAPKMDSDAILRKMHQLAPEWLKGCRLRSCYFEPTFYKYQKELCAGIEIHVDGGHYDHQQFRPYRLFLLFLKVFREVHPDFSLWRSPPYEYETVKLPIDLLNGNAFGKKWADDRNAKPGDLEKILRQDEEEWLDLRRPHLLYS